MECYNHSQVQVSFKGAASVAIKGQKSPVQVYTLIDGKVKINTDNLGAGVYHVQFFDASDNIIAEDKLTVKQNLKFAAADFDSRSSNQIALEAITAFMQGRATAQQRVIKVGDKEIQYSSFQELLKWREYFKKQVRKEQGKPASIKYEKLYYKGV